MPRYLITGPDGKRYKVTAPEGATEEEVLAKVKAQVEQAPVAQTKESYDPTGSFFENALAGVGQAFTNLGRGAQQALGIGDQQALQARIDESRRLDAPLNATAGGLVGNIAGNVAATLPTMAIPGVNTMAGATALGGVLGAAQPVVTGESRLANMALGAGGGAGGQLLGNAVGRALRPVRATPTAENAGLLRTAEREGIPTSAANKTGSRFLEVVDSVLDYIPLVGDKNTKAKAAQHEAWVAALFRRAGLDNATEASPAALSSAKEALGESYDDILSRHSVKLETEDMLNSLIEAEDQLNDFMSPKARTAVRKAVNLFQNNSEISARDFKGIYATLRDEVDDAYRGKGAGSTTAARVMDKIRGALKEAWESSATPEDVAALAQTDQRYAVLKSIEKATSDGKVSPKKLFNEMERRLPAVMKYGKGDQRVADLARIGRRFVADNVPNSGTAQRELALRALGQGGAGGMTFGLLSGAITPAAALGAAAGLGTPLMAQRAMWGPTQRYLTRGLLNAPPAFGQGLLSAARGSGAAMALQP